MKPGWELKTLSEVCRVFTDGNWIETKDQSAEGIRLVQTGNVGLGIFKDRRDKARFISETTFSDLKCFEVFPGDCLISRLPDPVGRACEIPETKDRMITAVDCSIVRTDPQKMDRNYFIYLSQSRAYLNEVDSLCSGTTRRRISRKNLGKITIPLPPLEEQKRIVSILDEAFEGLDRARENAEANLKSARELFERTFNTLLTSTKDEVAVEWSISSLGELCENLDSKRVPITKNQRVEGPIPYYGASGIVDYVQGHLFNEPLLLISEDGANLLARTYPIAFSIKGKTWVNNHAHVLRFDTAETRRFVELYLNSIPLDPYISGMAQPKLNQKKLTEIPIPVPNLQEQRRIIGLMDKCSDGYFKLESGYRVKLQDISDLRQSLLQKAFAGELI